MKATASRAALAMEQMGKEPNNRNRKSTDEREPSKASPMQPDLTPPSLPLSRLGLRRHVVKFTVCSVQPIEIVVCQPNKGLAQNGCG